MLRYFITSQSVEIVWGNVILLNIIDTSVLYVSFSHFLFCFLSTQNNLKYILIVLVPYKKHLTIKT